MNKDFIFITDVHIGAGSNVRTGDVYKDLLDKLEFVRDYCNDHNCQLLIGGDLFDKPTIADVYKAPFLVCFKSFKQVPYTIIGNHDRLFNTDDNLYKTSLNLFVKSGALKLLTTVQYGDLGLCLTSEKPMKNRGCAQIGMFHGFLNKEDGLNTVMMSDINVSDNSLCLLGHDHVVYDDLRIGAVRIVRPGSFLRGIRTDESNRTPQMVHIRFNSDDKSLKIKYVPIRCRDYKEIFKTKTVKLSSAQVQKSYEDVIQKIENINASEMTFMQAIKTVAPEDVCAYASQLRDEIEDKRVSR